MSTEHSGRKRFTRGSVDGRSSSVGFPNQPRNERIARHFARYLGDCRTLWHEPISERVPIAIHLAEPTSAVPFQVLVTSGMSAVPMNVPPTMDDPDEWKLAELCILLRHDWPLNDDTIDDLQTSWPLRLLKRLARLPHQFDVWVGKGHAIPNGDPPAPYARDTLLSGALLLPPYMLGNDFFRVPGDPPIHVYQVLPITAAELVARRSLGLEGLLERLEDALPDPYGALDPSRRSVC